MKQLSLLAQLHNIEKRELIEMLEDISLWGTLDIDYHPPRVERLWATTASGYRLCLHVIHECMEGEALYHPHPWPSAMKVLEGVYKMGVACEMGVDSHEPTNPLVFGGDSDGFIYSEGFKLREVANIEIGKDSYYEMSDEHGWHYVQPLTKEVFTIMLIGKPFENKSEGAKKADKDLFRLNDSRKSYILNKFKTLING